MNTTQWILVIVTAVPLALVLANRLRIDLAALLMAALLGALQFAGLGLLGPAHTPAAAANAFSGFSQSVVIVLIALFILTRGLEKSGVTRWIAQQIIRLGGNHPRRLILMFSAVTAFLSLFMNNLAAGALVLPSAMETARQTGIKPSKLLIPVAYGSLLGGCATYFTTANIVMSELLQIATPPQAPLNILSFTPTGGLIALVGLLFIWLFGDRLLPDREPNLQYGAGRHTGSELEDLYQIGERLWTAQISPDSPLIGQKLADLEIGKKWGVTVAAVHPNQRQVSFVTADQPIDAQCRLLLIGNPEKVGELSSLGIQAQPMLEPYYLSAHGLHLAEVILAPHSAWEGKSLRALEFRRRFGLSAIALHHLTRIYRTGVGDIPLALGDSLLVMGGLQQIRDLKASPEVIVLEPNPADQPILLKDALLTTGITLAAIGASIAGVPVEISVVIGAVLLLLLNILSMEDAYRAIEWQAIFLIAGMYAVSLAMVQTGLADWLGGKVLALLTPFGVYGLAGGAFLLTGLLTQVMGGQVAALVTGPVVLSAAISTGANPQAVAVATAIGCSASFLTPMAHPVNILMIAPANYKIKDFFRIGWPLTILSFGMLLVGLALFWRL